MGRKKGFDQKKIASIIGVLAMNQDGMWLRQIAKELGISPTTVSKYLNSVLKPLLDETNLGAGKKPMLRVIKLKPFVFEKLYEGRNINDILKMLEIYGKIGENK